jgi:hypothetical protein
MLNNLLSDRFIDTFAACSSEDSMFYLLEKNDVVAEISSALAIESLTENDIRAFTTTLVEEFTPGKSFPYQAQISALCVALGGRFSQYSNQYIEDVASLEYVEMLLANRIAKRIKSNREANGKFEITDATIAANEQSINTVVPLHRDTLYCAETA